MRKFLGDEHGSMLLAGTLISLMILASGYTYTQFYMKKGEEIVQRVAHQKAMDLAESGLADARQRLKAPDLGTFLPINSSQTLRSERADGFYGVDLARVTPTNTNLIEVNATGYFYLARGSYLGNSSPRRSQRALIKATIEISNVSEYLIALPGELPLNENTNVAGGKVYGKDLTFSDPGPGFIEVGRAYYYNSYSPLALPFVHWTDPDVAFHRPIPLTSPPAFPVLDAKTRTYYSDPDRATDLLPNFVGQISAPPGGKRIYYSAGNVTLADGAPLTVNGAFTIYAAGDVIIKNSIFRKDDLSWIAVVAEGDIIIDPPAPSITELNGTFMTNRKFITAGGGAYRGAGSKLQVNGGMVCLFAFEDFVTAWASRVYQYRTLVHPNILLPNFSILKEYQMVTGHY